MKFLNDDGVISAELRSIIENTNDLIFVKNRDFVYIACSENFARNCVYCGGAKEVIGKTDFELFADRDIAGKYRADDQALFTSGKSMIEFEEEYLSRDGVKHRCLMTKYLLHDRNRHPAAVFGQYHDIGAQVEKEIARLRDINKNVAAALSKSFFAANYADLLTHKFFTVQSMDYAREMVADCKTIEQAFEAFINTLVKPPFQAKMREFCQSDTIAPRLRGKTRIDCEYLSNVASGWCRASFFPTEWDKQGAVTHVLFAVSAIDEEKAKELEESIVNKENLKTMRMASVQGYEDRIQLLVGTYTDSLTFSHVNLTRDSLKMIKAEGVMRQLIESHESLEQLLTDAAELIVGETDRKTYLDTFSRTSLLNAFAQGQTSVKMEHLLRLSPTHVEWVESGFDLMKHPVTNEVVGVCHVKSVNTRRISNMVLEKALECDYITSAVVYTDSDEFYIFDTKGKELCILHQNFWERIQNDFRRFTDENEFQRAMSALTKERITRCLDAGEDFSFTFNSRQNGNIYRMLIKAVYLSREPQMLMISIRNITDADLLARYKYDSEHDPLTGLYNRNRVFQKCRELLKGHPEEQFVMLHADIRHFHLYNTFFGESAGDKLLCKMADLTKWLDTQNEHFAYGRIESDVFCMFFPVKLDSFEQHVKMCFAEINAFSPDFPLELAVGAYWVTDPAMSIEAMFSRATIAAKSHQKNLFGLIAQYDESMDEELRDTQQITSEMQTAIAQEQFLVYLQPKYSLRTEKLVGAEALVRWKHPEHGMVSPSKFIPVFEQNGFIAELDRYMWEHVCRMLRRWQDEGKPMYPVAINMSRVSLYSHATVPFLKSLIEKYRIDPRYLELELTETAYMDDPQEMKRMLKDLQAFGFKILMDDFGSGYSSLNTLRELPVDVLKLDMKFLSESMQDNRALAVLSSVVRMSKLLHLPIVAEGVEKREQADYLRSVGCEFVQGFLFARPMPVADYESLLAASGSNSEKMESTQNAADAEIEDPFIPLGVLEYAANRFAYLRTNKRMVRAFNLMHHAKPAVRIFREHLDDRNYRVLCQAAARCAETKREVLFRVNWTEADASCRKCFGQIRYNGCIDRMTDLSIVFLNVDETDVFGL